MIETSILGGLVFGGLAALLLLLAAVRRVAARRRRSAGPAPAAEADPQLRRLEIRLDEIEARLEAGIEAQGTAGGSEERLQAMAGSLVGLIRDKNAAMETALAGLDQLRARLRALEQMGDPAEARRLFETLGERVDALQAAQGAQGAALEERIAALKAQGEAGPQAVLAEQFGRLYAQKDAGLAAMLARLGPLETRLGALESARAAEMPARETLAGLEARLEALKAAQEAGQAGLAGLRAELGSGPLAELGQRLAGLHAQKDALAETLLARVAAVEDILAARDPQGALDRFAGRLEAVQGRVAALEDAENPFAEISEQLTRLYAQKDATVETVFARLAPLEARLGEIEAGLAARDPQGALDRFAERLETVQAAQAAAEGALRARIAALEVPAEALAALDGRIAALQEEAAARLAALQDTLGAAAAEPLGAIADQLDRLQAEKDAALAALEARLALLESRPADAEADAARAEAEAIAVGLAAAREAAAQTALFANRLALIEASLPRLSATQAGMMQALDRRGEPSAAEAAPAAPAESGDRTPGAGPDRAAGPVGDSEADLAALQQLPRVVSLHQK